MDLRHLVHSTFRREQIAVPQNHRSLDARSVGVQEMARTCSATRTRRSSQQRAALRKIQGARRRSATRHASIPHTTHPMRVPQRVAPKRQGGAECKAHRGITECNSLWANVLLFVTLTTKEHTMSQAPRLTDIPTTWEEYQQQKAVFSIEGSTMSPHHAVVAAHFDDQDAYHVSSFNQVTKNKPMFRLDNNSECSNVILTLIGTDAIFSSGGFNKHLEEEERAVRKGFAVPFDKTFDESGHQYTVSRSWTYATTKAVLSAAREVMQDAKLCATELSSSHDSPLLDYIEQRKPGVPRIASPMAALSCVSGGVLSIP